MVAAPERRRSIINESSNNGYPRQPQLTNTLILTKVPPALLKSPSLREFFERYGNIEAWVPLTTFERVVVVYTSEYDAEQAKLGMDYTLVEGFGSASTAANGDDEKSSSILRVYRGPPTSLNILRNRHFHTHLPVPETDKNFLISPPGSPPVGWEQIREDPPNMDTLADDLAHALEQLSTRNSRFDDSDSDDQDIAGMDADAQRSPMTSPSAARRSVPASPRDTLIIPHRRTDSGDLPSVLVSNTDMDTETSRTGLSIADAFAIQRRSPAARASPGPISQVRATVESMQGSSFQFPPTGPRIDRTPRPPLA